MTSLNTLISLETSCVSLVARTVDWEVEHKEVYKDFKLVPHLAALKLWLGAPRIEDYLYLCYNSQTFRVGAFRKTDSSRIRLRSGLRVNGVGTTARTSRREKV